MRPELLDERAAQIVAANLNGAGTQPTGPGYLAFLNSQGFPNTLHNFTLDITDEGIDKGIVPVPAGSHPDFFVNGNPTGASRLRYAQEATAGDSERPRLRRPRDQRRLDRGGLQQRDRGAVRGRAGIQLRARDLPAGAARRHEDLQLRG